MNFAEDEIQELKSICPGVQQYEEAGITYLFLPNLRMPDGCAPASVDALLCPTGAHGYTSRLFLAARVQSRESRNWNIQPRIMERNWEGISWNIPQPNLRLAQILAEHLRAFR